MEGLTRVISVNPLSTSRLGWIGQQRLDAVLEESPGEAGVEADSHLNT